MPRSASVRPRRMLPRSFRIGLLLATLCLFSPPTAGAASSQTFRYLQRTGEQSQSFSLTLNPGPPLQLSADSPGERHLTVMGSDYSTRHWQLTQTTEGTEILARRQGDSLLLSGRLRGQPVERRLEIDAAPWYQALSISLRNLFDQRIEALEFWTLRPDTLEVHKVRAVRQAQETLDIDGRPVAAWRIEVRLTGLKALFWHSHYWLRKSDGAFLRYRGPSGPPGQPLTEVRWAGEE
jgi:hypothetical protein